jgi:hypothetical protein
MNETGSGAAEPADRAYFSTIEAEFIRRRGTPFLLSPKDYALARRWFALGIPLEDVTAGVADAFDRREAREASGRVNSLSYCEGAVLEAWERRASGRVGKAGAPAEPEDVTARLEAIETGLDALAPRFAPAAEGARRTLARLRASGRAPEEIERSLARAEKSLLRDVDALLTEEERAAIVREVEARLGAGAASMEDAAVKRTREVLVRQRLRSAYAVPRLSLLS